KWGHISFDRLTAASRVLTQASLALLAGSVLSILMARSPAFVAAWTFSGRSSIKRMSPGSMSRSAKTDEKNLSSGFSTRRRHDTYCRSNNDQSPSASRAGLIDGRALDARHTFANFLNERIAQWESGYACFTAE